MMQIKDSGRFSPGRMLVMKRVIDIIPQEELLAALNRHLNCDWGDVSDSDRRSNDHALTAGERLVSCYHSKNDVKFYIITEWDRSLTTILLAEDY